MSAPGDGAIGDPLGPGSIVGGYRIERRLGGGGAGAVYAAVEPRIGKRVAIKVLHEGLAGDAAARLEREAKAANDVRHPGIVDVFGFGRLDGGRPYLVMSLLDGASLREEIEARGRIPLGEAWPIARAIAEALAAAHAKGVIHRDLKPDNVFLEKHAGRPPSPRILDFGLARTDGPASTRLTQSGAPLGTPVYMAPEQWWGAGVGPWSDQYAFGATLFEMLSGRPPFVETQFVALMQAHLNALPPTLAEAGVEAPSEVEALVARALAKSRDDRFSSMEALIEAGDQAFGPPATNAPAMASVTPAVIESKPLRASAAIEATESTKPAESSITSPVASAIAMVAALGAIAAAGYTGEARWDLHRLCLITGWSVWSSLAFFSAGAFALFHPRLRGTLAPWLFAVLTAFSGAFGTFSGMQKVTKVVAQWKVTERFVGMSVGTYEANGGRFLGFALTAALALALALPDRRGALRREPALAALALLGAAALALLAFAPGGAVVACFAAAALAASAFSAPDPRRSLAALLAVGSALAAASARLDAREAILWYAEPTRARRAAEIAAAAAERNVTSIVGVLALAVLALVEARRLVTASPRLLLARSPRGLAIAGLALATLAGDLATHRRTTLAREELRAALASQFVLFARLDPPNGDELDPQAFPPHGAAALQIARDVVAVNGEPVARLAALESDDGAQSLVRDLAHVLAKAAQKAEPGEPDLVIAIDREVRWPSIARALAAARSAGARRAELLFTRGPAPVLSPDAPPESAYVIASDFVAVPIELAGDGFQPAAAEPFGRVAPALLDQARVNVDRGAPLRLAAVRP